MIATTHSILDAIGNTPLIELRKVVPPGLGRIVAKLEWANPTGSMKDRMAKAVIERAEADGRLRPGGTVVEYTAAPPVSRWRLYAPRRATPWRSCFQTHSVMRSGGRCRRLARISRTSRATTRISTKAIRTLMRTAAEISLRPGHWYCDQLNNHDGIEGYLPLGDEIWQQTGGQIDAFVHAVSTAHSIHGVTKSLWKNNDRILIVAVEPAESAVLSGKPSGSHKIEGIGVGFIPPLWEPEQVNEIQTVTSEEAKAMARRLARE